MALRPKDYIPARRTEILQMIEELKLELGQLDAMESAIAPKVSSTVSWVDETVPGPMMTQQPATRQRFEKSIKEMVLEILAANNGAPLPALEILEAIKARFGAEIERTSLSPQLSRLKNDGMIAARNNAWAITMLGVASLAAEA